MVDLVQANARVPAPARPALLSVASRLRDDPGFLDRLQAFMADEAGGSAWADRIDAIEARLAALEAAGTERSDQIAEWVRLTEEKRVSAQVAPKSQGRPESGMNAASRELGIERTEVQRATKIASISDEAKEAGLHAATNADWPARAAAITISTGEGRGRKLTAAGAALFEDMVRAGVRVPEIARVFDMARQSVDARAKKVLAASS